MGGHLINVNQRRCLCLRRESTVLCNNCGHVMFGRVRYICPRHTMVTFLNDITQCPKCRAHRSMLQEVGLQDAENEPGHAIN